MGTKLEDEVAGFEPERSAQWRIGTKVVPMYALDSSPSSAGGHFVQVDEEPSRFSSWSDNVAVAVILPFPTLHCDQSLIRRNSRMLTWNRPLRAGFSKQPFVKKNTVVSFRLIESSLDVAGLLNGLT
jgi:hypothetical protein